MHGFENSPLASAHLQCKAGFTFVDFLPEIETPRKCFKPSTFENFRTLVDRANDFLRNNRKWKIVTCESVEFTKSCDKINSNEMTYVESGTLRTSYIRGLRIWLTERENEDYSVQQIGYFNLIPEMLEKGGFFKADKIETLDTAIERFNAMQQFNPLPGHIITIESQKMEVDNLKKFDPDCSEWTEIGDFMISYVFVIRIFYEIMDSNSEIIGVKDFIPDAISQECCCSIPEYERFSDVFTKASRWCAQKQDLRFCNAQTLELYCMSNDHEIDAQTMHYKETKTMTRSFFRILRVAFTKPLGNPYPIRENVLPITELTCKHFQPLQVTSGIFMPEYEDLIATEKRVSAWVKATGARVLSAETTAYRITYGSETSLVWRYTEKNEHWIFGIRLYLDGFYKEPPPEMLPPPPEVLERNCCQVS